MSAYQFENERRPIFSRGPLLVLKLAVLASLAVGLMHLDRQSDQLAPVRDGVSVALTPVMWLSDIPRKLQNLRTHVQSRENLIDENDDLRHEHLRINARLQKLLALEAENQRIRALLDSASQIHNAVMIGEIQSTSLDPYQQRIRVNRGKVDGVETGQALIDAHGIMGQIIEVTPYSSTAVLITDQSQGVPVQVNRNGLRTVVHGNGSQTITLPFLPANSDIQVGDLLVSSGLGNRYPAGYPVAMVEQIAHQPGEHFLEVSATPAAQLLRSREILLVLDHMAAPTTAELVDPTAKPGRIAAAD
ncbi:MAG: rod shape-determining protein MreC [Oceanococcus sp.]